MKLPESGVADRMGSRHHVIANSGERSQLEITHPLPVMTPHEEDDDTSDNGQTNHRAENGEQEALEALIG